MMYLTRTSSHPAAASGSRPRFRRRRLGDGSGWRCGVSVPAEGSLSGQRLPATGIAGV